MGGRQKGREAGREGGRKEGGRQDREDSNILGEKGIVEKDGN